LSYGETRQPQNSKNAAQQPELLAESRFGEVWRELVTTAAAVVNRVSPEGFTRMSLAGYSLAGWSPPEPASASPAKKIDSLG
jgi:hypothetical protein